MKKVILGALFAGLTLASCSSDEPTPATNEGGDTGNTSYVSIAIASNNGTGSRAEYENGTEAEGAVKNVVLFFYDAAGQPLNVNMGTTNTNYKIIKNPSLNDPTESIGTEYNVEHWFQQTQKLNTKAQVSSAKVLAMVNVNVETDPSTGYDFMYNYNHSGKVSSSYTIDQLSSKTSLFTGETYTAPLGDSNRKANPEFVMTSSTYLNEGMDAVMREVDVNVYEKKEDAEKEGNVATIYVERVRARVQLTAGGTRDADGCYKPTFNENDKFPAEVNRDEVRLKVLGWTLNTVSKYAYYFKQLEAKNYNYGWTWNDPIHHRSYWEDAFEISNKAASETYFDKVSFTPSTITKQPGDACEYINPNTADFPTQVIVHTQLLDASGNPVQIAKWFGTDYMIDELPAAVLSTVPENKIYVKKSGKVSDGYVGVTEDYITFEQGTGKADADETNCSWRAYPILKKTADDGTEIQYYEHVETALNPNGVVECSYDRANYLLGFYKGETDKTYATQGAKVWTNGEAYYFVPIKHFGKEEKTRTVGVVRNHSYNVEIEGFKGLGTPIYNPDQLIPEPDVPEDDKESYVAVKMNVLSWRIVPKQTVIFGD